MRLVDHEHADRHALERLDEAGRGEALGRDVEQPHAPVAHARERVAVLAGVALAVDQRRTPGDGALEPGDLVGHQRDQRRDDDRDLVRAHQRRQLVAERLAGAGRHHDQHVATAERGRHHLLLPGAEGGVAEVLVQGGVKVAHRVSDDSGEVGWDGRRRPAPASEQAEKLGAGDAECVDNAMR